MNDLTQSSWPTPHRPRDGFSAWQVTLGYISTHHSPDAILKVQLEPTDAEGAVWSASISWGQEGESVHNQPSLAEALEQLWQIVERNHIIFLTPEDAIRKPAGYEAHEWLNDDLEERLDRLVQTTQAVFERDWRLIFVYQPTENPATRVQARLLAKDNRLRVGARGPSLAEAAHTLYRNAGPHYATHSGTDFLASGDLS